MYSIYTLDIAGYHQEPVPHTFFRQQEESHHAAIICAGFINNCQHPTLYYPYRELLLQGADTLLVDYGLRPGFTDFSDEEIKACLQADTIAASQALFHHRTYSHLTLIGKSLGTLAMGYLLTSVPSLPQVQAIWLTPLLKREELLAQIKQRHPRSLFVIGTEDPHYNALVLAELEQATGGETLAIKGANHLLEVSEGITASLRVMEQVIETIRAFVDPKN